ncbi:DUF916 and DUF3324 domain-containing protein [Latilactobacillus graminis]|uniref:DUF3324 domain-containing protein n=2 Tax=Latilactobacillus graminis TaxID=60519 RepID=A0AA89KYI0_9LACO|nr:DUF916 and DUF3324 domain-containing protein [Latilactobacillus graminis]KRM24415.1 hypothetical protein FC90_GL000556 [Latilactobacillus graminis DSM 20719]QFP80035.1 DUF916 and DUF3324 domain-containing protein [Latilactobacillus graminis]
MFRKRLLRTIILGVALGVMGGLTVAQQAQAASSVEKADFEIQPIMPEGQVDTSLNYFDVKFKPGTTHTIKMRVQNFTDKKITVKNEFQNSMTQMGGDMKFQTATNGLDPSAKVPLTTIGAVRKSDRVIHLGPEETTVIQATIKMPDRKLNGMIAGGWHFIEYRGNSTKDQTISSNYAYLIGVNLQGSHYKVYPELKYASTKPILYNRRPAMGIKLRNTQPMVLRNVHFKAVVAKQGLFADKRLYEKTGSSIAPNSSVTLPISWEYNNMKPGKYTVSVKVTGENLWNKLPMSWTFKKHFKVTRAAATSLNKRSVQRPTNKWLYVMAANGVLLLVAAYGLYRVIRIG